MGCVNMNEAFAEILQSDIPTSFERFGRDIDQQWIDDALRETGTASVRKRKIPATLVIWLVIGMALFRDRAIQESGGALGSIFFKTEKTTRERRRSLVDLWANSRAVE